MADVFISYKREDRARIAPLARALEARGYTVWWDLELIAGQKWGKKIKAELDAAKCVIVVWTTQSVAADRTYVSEWVENEADEALKRGVLVPVVIEAPDDSVVHSPGKGMCVTVQMARGTLRLEGAIDAEVLRGLVQALSAR